MNSIHYDKLVDSYYENLHTTLRNFRPGPEFLESWVHDEDHNRSIIGIFEAAKSYGISDLSLEIGSRFVDSLDRSWLQENLAEFGAASFLDQTGGMTVRLEFSRNQAEQNVHPLYRKALDIASRSIQYEGSASAATGETRLESSVNGMRLSCAIDSSNLVVSAGHQNATGNYRPLLDQLCKFLIGRPLQEGAEHAVIRLEWALREEGVKPPVLGLLTPENADPIFRIPTQLVRNLFQQSLAVKETGPQWNNWEDPLSPAWSALSDSEKLASIRRAWDAACADRKLPYQGLELVEIRHGYRVYFSGQGSHMQDKAFGHAFLLLEVELKQRLSEPRLELVLEGVEDRNNREKRTQRESF